MSKIIHLNNFLSDNECQNQIDWIEENLTNFLFLDHRQRYMLRFGYDEEYPDHAHQTLDLLENNKNNILKILNKIIDSAKEYFEESELYVGSFFLSKHLPDSLVPPHYDGTDNFNKPLHYTALIYLNSLDDSGKLYFNILNKTILPQSGDLVMFNTHSKASLHSVAEVNANRYSIPVWLTKDKDFDILSKLG